MPNRHDRRQAIALFRYALIREAAEPTLTPRERGALVRDLARGDQLGPDGERVRVSRPTLDRWIRAWRAGGFAALVPDPRVGVPRTPAELLTLAEALKREAPKRTAAQIAAILVETRGTSPNPRTLQRYFARLGLNRTPDGRAPRAFGRFEAERPNALWTGDALHGGPIVAAPATGGATRKAYLFCFIDDYSRLLAGYRWGLAEDTVRLEAALRAGLAARGVPARLYVDNGSSFVSAELLRACASLGIRLVHSRPGEPAGRGKIERAFGTVRGQFLTELAARGGAGDLDELNRLFAAWVEGVYHRRVHRETGQTPLERFERGDPPRLPGPAELHEAFLWSATRQVTKTATVGLHGNTYQVDPALVGSTVELVFDPFDLTQIQVRLRGRPMGIASPQRIGRHVHPKARPEPADPPPPTGIDYLALVEARHAQATRTRIAYACLPLPGIADDHPTQPPDTCPPEQQEHR
jgi:putative transposase